MNSICLLFSLYAKDDLYREAIQLFLDNAIVEDVDFYIIVQGDCTVRIPQRENVFVFHRENKGYDFGSWSHALKQIKHRNYEYIFFANSSITGPYIKDGLAWYVPFLELLGPDVHLVGTSIDTCEIAKCMGNKDVLHLMYYLFGEKRFFSYVQSMFFCLDREGLEYLQSFNFFDEDRFNSFREKDSVILMGEHAMSQYILNHGWNINALVQPYRGRDFRTLDENLNSDGSHLPSCPGSYFRSCIKPKDVVFFKFNCYGFIPRL